MAVKNPAKWIPKTGQGFIVFVGLLNLQDNLGHLFQDNLGHLLVINPIKVTGKNPAAWTNSGV